MRVNVPTDVVTKALQENRAKHAERFKQDCVDYQQVVQTALNVAKKSIDAGDFKDWNNELTTLAYKKPRNYLREYDAALQLIDFSQQPTVELDSTDYKQFVLDEWSWSEDFYSNRKFYNEANTSYTAKLLSF